MSCHEYKYKKIKHQIHIYCNWTQTNIDRISTEWNIKDWVWDDKKFENPNMGPWYEIYFVLLKLDILFLVIQKKLSHPPDKKCPLRFHVCQNTTKQTKKAEKDLITFRPIKRHFQKRSKMSWKKCSKGGSFTHKR